VVLDATSYPDALARSRAIDGRGLSTQAWNLVPKIRELDAAIDPELQAVVREAHPELAFARLLGEPCPSPKRAADGLASRCETLELWWSGPWRLAGARPDDVADAVALTRTAARMARGEVEMLGDGARDARGLRMEVVW
jgi:predicted RNase H-like nuclease